MGGQLQDNVTNDRFEILEVLPREYLGTRPTELTPPPSLQHCSYCSSCSSCSQTLRLGLLGFRVNDQQNINFAESLVIKQNENIKSNNNNFILMGETLVGFQKIIFKQRYYTQTFLLFLGSILFPQVISSKIPKFTFQL